MRKPFIIYDDGSEEFKDWFNNVFMADNSENIKQLKERLRKFEHIVTDNTKGDD